MYKVVAPPLHSAFSMHDLAVFNSGMLLGLGGNPYGPAGTGKTESVKALGNYFGRQVLVFNCDEVRHNVVCHAVSHPIL